MILNFNKQIKIFLKCSSWSTNRRLRSWCNRVRESFIGNSRLVFWIGKIRIFSQQIEIKSKVIFEIFLIGSNLHVLFYCREDFWMSIKGNSLASLWSSRFWSRRAWSSLGISLNLTRSDFLYFYFQFQNKPKRYSKSFS